ncbi:MAG: macro domain-containing protein [Acidobacteria bacterium]|nr:macro domain-containing protein [Acidobacteriota bacterium]
MENKVNYHLRDKEEKMVEAWEKAFDAIAEVRISQGNIMEIKADAIISPANSFGFMDGGIDLAYSQFFGWQLQERLQSLIVTEYDGELPIGQAIIISTDNEFIPYLISAPTMRLPMDVSDSVNAYLAFRASILAVKRFNQTNPNSINSVICPGLCTATGRMPYDRAAKQMSIAYRNFVLGQLKLPLHPAYLLNEHFRLIR